MGLKELKRKREGKPKLGKILSKYGIYAVLLLFLIIYLTLASKNANILTGDEVFYYDQGLNIREGKFVYFENTQPLLFPALISMTFTEDVFLLRLIPLIASILLMYFLYELLSERFNKKTAIIAVVLLGFSKFFIHYSVTLHTESLFLLFLVLSLKYFFRSIEKGNLKYYILLGIFSGLAIETKIQGLAIPIIFSGYLLYYNTRKFFDLKYILSLIISVVLLIPYMIVGGTKFLVEKSIMTRGLGEFSFSIVNLVSYTTIWLVLIVFLALFFKRFNDKNKIIYIFPLGFLIFLLLPATILFTRHFIPIIPFACIIAADALISQKKLSLKILFGVLIICYLISNIRIIPEIPRLYYQAYYLDTPQGCQEIEYWWYRGESIKMPFFEQESGTQEEYYAEFTAERDYDYIIVQFLDDHALYADVDNDFIEDYHPYPYSRDIFTTKITEGSHNVRIVVENVMNIGGIGQVMICNTTELHEGVSFIFPTEEII